MARLTSFCRLDDDPDPTYWFNFFAWQRDGSYKFDYRVITSLSCIEEHLRNRTDVPLVVGRSICEIARQDAKQTHPVSRRYKF